MYIHRVLARRLKTIANMTIVHVGAHHGQEAEQYQRWGAKHVIWVEADPKTVPILQSKLKQVKDLGPNMLARLFGSTGTKHTIINALVGDSDGQKVDFHVFSNEGASSSIFKATDVLTEKFPELEATGKPVKIEMRKLDTLLPEHGVPLEEVDFLAMDIQGAELLCLKGAEALLEQIRYLESEVSRKAFYDGGVLLEEFDAWLAARKFFRKTWVRRDMMNAVYVRSAG